jgi:hypothetical protein
MKAEFVLPFDDDEKRKQTRRHLHLKNGAVRLLVALRGRPGQTTAELSRRAPLSQPMVDYYVGRKLTLLVARVANKPGRWVLREEAHPAVKGIESLFAALDGIRQVPR